MVVIDRTELQITPIGYNYKLPLLFINLNNTQ